MVTEVVSESLLCSPVGMVRLPVGTGVEKVQDRMVKCECFPCSGSGTATSLTVTTTRDVSFEGE